MLNTRLYQGYTNAISASSLLPLRSHSASLRNGEKLQKTAGRGAKDTALALPMSLVFEYRIEIQRRIEKGFGCFGH